MQAARQASSSCMSVTRVVITADSHCDTCVMAEFGCSFGVYKVIETRSGCKGVLFCAERGKIPCAALFLSRVHHLLQEPWVREQQRPPQSTGRCAHG